MVISAAKIRALEKKAKAHLIGQNTFKSVPKEWEAFVKLCTIRSGGKMVQFIPYDFQKILIKLRQDYPNIVVIKSRQVGCTQAIASDDLKDACTNAASSSVFFMRNGDDVGSLSRRIKQMLHGLREYVLPANDSVGYIKIKALGDIYIKNSSKEGIRSLDSITNQTYDESAFIENIESIYAASNAASALVGDKVKKMIISTPSAKMGWYWNQLSQNNNEDIEEICKQVASGDLYKDIPGFYYFVDAAGALKVVLHWRCHPVYTQIDKEYPGGYLAYRMKQDNCDEEIVLREYDLRFIDSSVAVFTSDLVRASAVGEWENERDITAEYFIGIDTATLGSDYCVAIVLKKKYNLYSVVAMYRKRQQTSVYNLFEIGRLIEQYRPDKVAIEITGGVGSLYLESLVREFPGYSFEAIKTTGDSKPAMISGLQLALEKNSLVYPTKSPIKDELLSFRRLGNKLEASSGQYDDCVMSLSFALLIATNYTSEWSLI
ncbi:Terminase-like family protein [Nostoc parmelioides]|uniref:Terminase-like family protein n=1 Tax=Nostoc parmelioides FACHB-3921 TaxID=2692909 RepID=A0ABR8BRY2_9NOSO|nr:Terminase-like family protein [Nostoc parmelioides]MBD2255596.1 Terminase-like family protein [Nostoc parmelioides FACHB-3921]